jgi:hypothetical protein
MNPEPKPRINSTYSPTVELYTIFQGPYLLQRYGGNHIAEEGPAPARQMLAAKLALWFRV